MNISNRNEIFDITREKEATKALKQEHHRCPIILESSALRTDILLKVVSKDKRNMTPGLFVVVFSSFVIWQLEITI